MALCEKESVTQADEGTEAVARRRLEDRSSLVDERKLPLVLAIRLLDFCGRVFHTWHDWVIASGLKPMIKVAKMLERHLPEILSYFRYRITNAMSEGYNSKIQFIKSAARGFRAFENYRTRILFYCGKLDLKPKTSH